MTVDEALVVVNTAAHLSQQPFSNTLYAIKCSALKAAIERGYPVRYLYDRLPPSTPPWAEDPQIISLPYGPYYFDLVEVRVMDKDFHVPVPQAHEHGLIDALRRVDLQYAKRDPSPTGSKLLVMPTRRRLAKACSVLVNWTAHTQGIPA